MKHAQNTPADMLQKLKIQLILLISLMACFLFSFLAFSKEAETELEEVDTTYTAYLDRSADATALMVSRAIQEEVFLTEGESGWDFRTVEFASPKKALLVFPTDEQQAQLIGAFGTADRTSLLTAIANAVNSQFSEDYAKLSQSIAMEEDIYSSLADEHSMAMVLLFYDRHISFSLFADAGYSTIFLMSDESVLASVNDSYIPDRISQMGVTGDVDQVIYDADTIDAIAEKEGYRSGVDNIMHAVTASEETFRRMLPEMISGCMYKHNSNITIEKMASFYAEDHVQEYASKFELIPAMRKLMEETLAENEAWSWNGVSIVGEEYTGFTETEEAPVYQPDQKLMVISRDRQDGSVEIDYAIESILPVENIPSSAEEADQIILVDSDWTYDSMNNGIKVYDCKTIISLYDAQTMEKLGIIGSSFSTLSGFVMVSGDSYYPPVNIADVKKVLSNWIFGDEAEDMTEAETE